MSRQRISKEHQAIRTQKIDAFFDYIKVLNDQDFERKLELLKQSLSLRQIEIPDEFDQDAREIHRRIYRIYQTIHLCSNVKQLRENYDEITKNSHLEQSKELRIKKQLLKRYPFKSVKKDFLIAKAAIEYYRHFLDLVDHGYVGLRRLKVLYDQYMEKQKYCFHLNFLQFAWDEIKDRYENRKISIFKRTLNGIDFNMIACPAGDIYISDIQPHSSFNHDRYPKWVKTDPFWISETPVTIALWCEVMSPYLHKNPYRFLDHFQKTTNPIHPNYPVTSVNFYNAIVFCNRLSKFEGFSPYYQIKKSKKYSQFVEDDQYDPLEIDEEIDGDDDLAMLYTDLSLYRITINDQSNGYHLPSEAQWEFAAKSCHPKEYDGCQHQLPEVLRYMNRNDQQAKIVKSSKPNQIGLYALGDLFEMCYDDDDKIVVYKTPSIRGWHIVKGGLSKEKFHASSKGKYEAYYGEHLLGFRIVRSEC
jgi:sulfatase modifying factor 1